jgi:hypothetical protein
MDVPGYVFHLTCWNLQANVQSLWWTKYEQNSEKDHKVAGTKFTSNSRKRFKSKNVFQSSLNFSFRI